jgi:hypothetical protein
MWPDGRNNGEDERKEKEKSGGDEDGSLAIAVAEEATGLLMATSEVEPQRLCGDSTVRIYPQISE